ELPGRSVLDIVGFRGAGGPAPTYALARKIVRVPCRVSRRPHGNSAARPEVRFQLAALLLPGHASKAAQGDADRVYGPLRQLTEQRLQSESTHRGPLGRSELGRDDDRVVRSGD